MRQQLIDPNTWPPRARTLGLSLYYLLVIAGLIMLYGRGDFSTPGFIYQGF